nr:FAD binding domain-containing protein [Acidobacteriota bacterium]
MKPFTLLPVRSLPEAARESARPGSLVKAGGVDLLDRMKEGLDAPDRVVSIAHIPGHDGITVGPPGRIGALATLAKLDGHAELRRVYPALADAAGGAATPQIRNMATLGGNLAQRPRCWYYRQAEFDCRKKAGAECFALEGENRFHAIFDTEVCCCVHPSATATALVAYGARIETLSPK